MENHEGLDQELKTVKGLRGRRGLVLVMLAGGLAVFLFLANATLEAGYKVDEMRVVLQGFEQRIEDQKAKMDKMQILIENLQYENTTINRGLAVVNHYIYTKKNDRIKEVTILKLVKNEDGATFDLVYQWDGATAPVATRIDYTVGVFSTDLDGLNLDPKGLDGLALGWATSSQYPGPEVVLVMDPTNTYIQQIFREGTP